MPEMIFRVRWPDGAEADCYSPSLVIREHLAPGEDYAVAAFLEKSSIALQDASERVRARYGFPCRRALGQLRAIEQECGRFAAQPDARVRVLSFR